MFSNPLSFNGRIRRTEYAITFVSYLIIVFIITAASETRGMEAIGLLILPFIWILWAQGAKRCHDLGKSGFYQLIPFYFLVMIFGSGNYGENEYGENPKGEGNAEPEYPFGYDVKNKIMLETEKSTASEDNPIQNSETNSNSEQI